MIFRSQQNSAQITWTLVLWGAWHWGKVSFWRRKIIFKKASRYPERSIAPAAGQQLSLEQAILYAIRCLEQIG